MAQGVCVRATYGPVEDAMAEACTYCGSDVHRHTPVYVEAAADDGGREPAGRFCNYACLKAHIEDAGLETGASCEWVPPS